MLSIGNASILEIIWTFLAIFGSCYAIPNWRRARRKRQQLRAKKINGINDRLARKEVRLQRNIAMSLGGLILLGGVLMTQPAGSGGGQMTIGGIVLGAMLIFAAPALTVWSIAERRDSEAADAEIGRLLAARRRQFADRAAAEVALAKGTNE